MEVFNSEELIYNKLLKFTKDSPSNYDWWGEPSTVVLACWKVVLMQLQIYNEMYHIQFHSDEDCCLDILFKEE